MEKEKVYTLEQRWLDAWNTNFPHWEARLLQIELNAVNESILFFETVEYPLELERLRFKREYLKKLIEEKIVEESK